MWSRAIFKKRAKKVLSKSYWIAFLVCLLGGIITGGSAGFSAPIHSGNSNYFSGASHSGIPEFFNDPAVIATFICVFAIIFVAIFAFILAYSFFVAFPVRVGYSKFFLENRKGNTEFVKLFYAFKKGKYLDIVKSMAWRYLFQFLWTLCFIIPGIIKAYSYCMVPYILADNPNIGYRRALKLSMDMTSGCKWKIFVLQLSFIGWYLLGVLCCGIGVLFVNPYYKATIAEVYGTVRKNAIEKGYCTTQELNLSESDILLDSEGFNN